MTECTQETFGFTAHFSRRVEAGFTAGQVSSDGGRRCCARWTARSTCWPDWRAVSWTGAIRSASSCRAAVKSRIFN